MRLWMLYLQQLMKSVVRKMKLTLIQACTLPFIYIIFFQSTLSAEDDSDIKASPLWKQVAVLQENLQSHGVLGSVIAISMPGNKDYYQSSGYVDKEQKVAMDDSRLFQIGSQTKMFTAAAILLLNKQGKLTLSNKVSEFFDGIALPPELTIQHLLNHTGGIGDSILLFDPDASRPDYTLSFEDHLTIGRAMGIQFSPGSQWEYNNLGYLILGKIVEKVSATSLSHYLREQLLNPLGMHDTYFGNLEEWPEEQMARGYFIKKPPLLIDSTKPDLSWASSAGDMISSTEDLLKWFHALQNAENPTGLTLDSFRQSVVDTNAEGPMEHYGLGFMERNQNGTLMWGHGGVIHGYISLTVIDPTTNIVICLMANLVNHPDELLPLFESTVSLTYQLALLQHQISETKNH